MRRRGKLVPALRVRAVSLCGTRLAHETQWPALPPHTLAFLGPHVPRSRSATTPGAWWVPARTLPLERRETQLQLTEPSWETWPPGKAKVYLC